MDIIMKIAIVLAAGMVGGKIADRLKLPNVSGYLVAGLFLGPSFIKLLTENELTQLDFISEIALAFIAFSIGSEFVFSEMRKVGKQVLVITILEVIGAIALVFSVMYFIFNQDFAFSIVIASMSAATAPAATLLVIKQYRAYGPLTKTVLPVVALDDVFGIMAFGIAMSLAKMSISETSHSFVQMLGSVSWEIFGSIGFGTLIGFALVFILKQMKVRDDFQVASLIAIGLGMGFAKLFNLSPLLINIMIGTIIVNFLPRNERAFEAINDFTPAFYVLFFTIAGASLDLKILKIVGLAGVVYVFARGFGKMLGAYIGAKATRAGKTISRYLGLTLLPQGGVSIGLSVLVRQQLPKYAQEITTIIMFSILIYEVTGPIFSKIAIDKAGEINGLDRLEAQHESQEVEVPTQSEELILEH